VWRGFTWRTLQLAGGWFFRNYTSQTKVCATCRLEFILLGETMAKLALVYGMRLFPEDELGEVSEAVVTLKDGRKARVTMHLIEGSKEQIEETLKQSMDAFFEMYPEI
jgi:hypothetical protein